MILYYLRNQQGVHSLLSTVLENWRSLLWAHWARYVLQPATSPATGPAGSVKIESYQRVGAHKSLVMYDGVTVHCCQSC